MVDLSFAPPLYSSTLLFLNFFGYSTFSLHTPNMSSASTPSLPPELWINVRQNLNDLTSLWFCRTIFHAFMSYVEAVFRTQIIPRKITMT